MIEARETDHSEPADLIVTGGLVLTLNQQDERFDPGAVAIRGETIAAVGPAPEIARRYRAAKTINAGGCIVLPGLINAHTHAAMTLFRGLADDLPLMEWLQEHIFPAEQKLTAEWVYWGSLLACGEMILGGITTFCDMYLFEHQVARAAHQAGIRALIGEVLYDFPSPHYGPIEAGLRFTEELIKTWRDDPLIHIAVEPHALYTCSPELLRRCHELAEWYNVPLITHLAENQDEVAQIQKRYGCRPVVHLERLGILSDRLIADHCVALDDHDQELLAHHRVNVVHQPESNMKLVSGIAPIPQLLERGVNVAIGTDGCASNNDLDIFSEMDTCAKLHKVACQDPTVVPALSVLRMATVNGAKALGFEGKTGVLCPGMWADCIVVDCNKPHLTPMYDAASHLVYAAGPADVRHTIIHGQLVMENRIILTFDINEAMQHVRESARIIRP